MTHNLNQSTRRIALASLLLGISLTFGNCSGEKKETDTETTTTNGTATADSTVFGRQGDTLNSSSMDAPQQAPPDNASAGGAVVPAEVKVRAKQ